MLVAILAVVTIMTTNHSGHNQRVFWTNFDQFSVPENSSRDHIITFHDIASCNKSFRILSEDLLVMLHIQKTGGTTFEKHLVNDLNIDFPCSCNEDKRRCSCPRSPRPSDGDLLANSTWLFSRFSTGWACGLHADWTMLNRCLSNHRNLFFVTFLRHPIERFISEFRHVQRGATWKAAKNHCKSHDTHYCYSNRPNWSNVSLEEFLDCPYNTAFNRQTHMLADYNQIQCDKPGYSHITFWDDVILSTAMKNLESTAFFGLCEQQRISQSLFEKTFRLRFKSNFEQSLDNKTRNLVQDLPVHIRKRIESSNRLDMKLYDFAKELFGRRYKMLTSGQVPLL